MIAFISDYKEDVLVANILNMPLTTLSEREYNRV